MYDMPPRLQAMIKGEEMKSFYDFVQFFLHLLNYVYLNWLLVFNIDCIFLLLITWIVVCINYRTNSLNANLHFLVMNKILIKFIAKNKHKMYLLVYKLMTLVVILSVTTTIVERAFSTMTYVKNRLRNCIED